MAKTYYTYRIRVANYERVQVEKWDAQHQSLGEPSGVFSYKKLGEITPLLQVARNNELKDSSKARTIGEALFDVLFDDVLRQDFVNFYYQVVQKEKQLLLVDLDIDERGMPDVAALPWEFTCLPGKANLGEIWMDTDPNLIFARRRAQWHAAPPIQLNQGEKLKIALAIAAPTGSSDLGLVVYEKVQAVLEKLASSQSDRVELLPIVNPATPEAIDAVLEQQPHIFHFIGHGRLKNKAGEEVGQIALVDMFDEALWVDASFFGGLFNRHHPGVVMLQACEGGMLSASQAFVGVASKIVQQNIPVIVAMQYEVTNVTASRFAYHFYERLAQDDPVDIAAQNGRRAIALNTQYRNRDFATPIIFMRVQDGYLFKRPGSHPNSTSGADNSFLVEEIKDLNYSESCARQELRYLENKLNSVSYTPSQPTGKPAYFVDSQVFRLMPFDIGTIWGLQRSSFIGLLIGFEQTKIYESLKNVEFVLSQAIEANQKVNESASVLPKREWIQIDINRHPGAPCQKAQIIDAAVDRSNKVTDSLRENSFPNSSIPGFFFEIHAKQLHTGYSEQIKNWCEALLSQLFPSYALAIIINIISSIDEDIERRVKTLKTQLREISEEIPIELMRLDARLFFANNISSPKTGQTDFINIEGKPGLPFCSWMHHVLTRSFKREKLDKERKKYRNIIDLYINLKEQYSEKEWQDTYSGITARDVLLDIQALAPTMQKKAYYQLLHLIVNLFPQWSYEWVGVYAESAIEDAVRAALIIATNAGLLSDLLMDAWVNAIDIDRFNIDLLYQEWAITPDYYNINNLKLEGLFLALMRREQARSDKKNQSLLQKLALSSPSLQALHHFYQNQKENENEFINQNDPNQFTLAIRAKVKIERAINQFKAAPTSHLPTAICWLLAANPPSQNNITELLQLEAKKRAVFGLCTPQEWQQIKKRQENERQVLDCRRERRLIYSHSSLTNI
ncbi:MAG: CHAT domain-containing protein [Coleofasciculus sp. A1-SPW-01]|uniref:CHAT domain-containing protein n=1 Tax=Coleofasciculus sp. A1-SPW-01 TaxID=3070819 RepID=UPI0032F28C44